VLCITNLSSMNVCSLEIKSCSRLSFLNNSGEFRSASYRGANSCNYSFNDLLDYDYYGFGMAGNTIVYNSTDKHRFQSSR
jgi:hypothetical protein